GDLSVLTEDPCPCGRTAFRLRKILGRVGEAVKVRGIFVHPFQLRTAMARVPQALRYQFAVRREHDRDELVARVEGDRADPALAGRLQEAVRDVTRLRSAVEFVSPGSLPQQAKVLVDERGGD
ncbi:MAG TPA: phenylacetate--CoA ligase family protein, partial [bacterium]|nr:phenylacetate--CoA ligase family protein [bacterium]